MLENTVILDMITVRKGRKKTSPIWKIEKSLLEELVKTCKTFGEILSHFNLPNKGGTPSVLKYRLKQENIDFSHIKLGRNSNRGRAFSNRGLTLEEAKAVVFIANSTYTTYTAKKYLRQYRLKSYECETCKLKDAWLGKELSLQLDHKNGDDRNHTLENLRWLCPNCHSQTETFGSRNRKTKSRCECK